jgi:hypothetical protein
MEKLNQEELNLVQEFNNKSNQIIFEIGKLDVSKNNLLQVLKELNDSFKIELDNLASKYGDCNIDINTGEITKKETDNVENKDV